MPITQQEIANRLGVSRQLVNFALNGGGTVSEQKRREILAVAGELGYRRNDLARAVATGKYQVFGFLKQRTNELIGYELAGMNEVASAHGYAVKVVQGVAGEEKDVLIQRCAQMRVAGWVALQLTPRYQEDLRRELKRFSTPLVVLDNSFPQPTGVRVVGDDRLGVRLGVEHLYDLGHRRIAFIGGPPHSGSAEARRSGYREAMHSSGLPLPCEPVPTHYLDGGDIEVAVKELLLQASRPTAILCVSDIVAMVACRTARRMGLEVPKQLSVVGYDNVQMTAYTDPPLTSVAQPFEEMGRVAARRLLEAVEHDYEVHDNQLIEDLLPPHLVVRESTAPVLAN